MIKKTGGRIALHPVQATWNDAYLVSRWRNLPEMRAAFYDKDVVTPDTHMQFMAQRKPHDLIWLAQAKDAGYVGMTSLTVDVKHRTAEYGRTLVDPRYRGKGYGREIEYTVLWYAFEILYLDNLWLDAYTTNEAIIGLHYSTGWTSAGVNLPGHTDNGGDVLHMTYIAAMWRDKRQDFAKKCNVELGEWTSA